MKYFTVVLLVYTLIGRDVSCKNHGRRSDNKIVGGTNVNITQYPYQAYLLLQQGNDYYQCGGSIISNRAILTAAHCMQGIQRVHVRIGSSQAQSGGTQYQSTDFRVHPFYNKKPYDYDVAVIRMPTAMNLDGVNARAVRLPSRNTAIPGGTDLVVSGWGATSEGSDVSSELMAVTVPTITNEECNQKLSGITARMVCAGTNEGGKDSCQGDSGGPAVSTQNGMQLGIVSFGVGCARPNLPGVYTRIPAVRSWISLNAGV